MVDVAPALVADVDVEKAVDAAGVVEGLYLPMRRTMLMVLPSPREQSYRLHDGSRRTAFNRAEYGLLTTARDVFQNDRILMVHTATNCRSVVTVNVIKMRAVLRKRQYFKKLLDLRSEVISNSNV